MVKLPAAGTIFLMLLSTLTRPGAGAAQGAGSEPAPAPGATAGETAAEVLSGSALSLDFGVVRHGQSDRSASALRYSGTAPVIGLGYERVRSRSRLELGASFAMGTLTSTITEANVPREDAWLGRLGLRYLRRVATAAGHRMTLLAGGQIDAHALFRIHHYIEQGTEDYADLLVPLQLAAGWEWAFGGAAAGTRIGQRLALPVLGLVMRTPYGGLKYVPPLELAPPGEILGLDQELFVERTGSRRVGIRVAWLFRVLQHPEPHQLRLVTHRVMLGGLLRLGGGG